MKAVDAAFFTNRIYASADIRGRQIASKLGVPCDEPLAPGQKHPKSIVLVKAVPGDIESLKSFLWFDIVDSDDRLDWIAGLPNAGVIAIGITAERYLKARLNIPVALVPEHHCNFERCVRKANAVSKVVGFCGYENNLDLNVEALRKRLAAVNMEFKMLPVTGNLTREDVCEFYKGIDINLTFRLPRIVAKMPPELKNPLKVINAASFGIPTVGYPEVSYEEFPPYIRVHDEEEVVDACVRLKHFDDSARRCLLRNAEQYHIDNIVELYRSILQ